MIKSMYGVVTAVRAEQYWEELCQFTVHDGESITDMDTWLWMLLSKLQSQGIATNGAVRRSALLSALISEDWDNEVARRWGMAYESYEVTLASLCEYECEQWNHIMTHQQYGKQKASFTADGDLHLSLAEWTCQSEDWQVHSANSRYKSHSLVGG